MQYMAACNLHGELASTLMIKAAPELSENKQQQYASDTCEYANNCDYTKSHATHHYR